MTEAQNTTQGNQKALAFARRPFGVTILALGVLIIAVGNLIRLVQVVLNWSFLVSLPNISRFYMAITGAIAAGSGFLLVYFLWTGNRAGPKALWIFAPAYTLYFWFDRTLIAKDVVQLRSSSPLLFYIGITAISLALMIWVVTRPKTKAYFGESNDRKPKI